MAKQRHIGFVIFGLCSALSARIAVFEPKPHVPTPAEERWGTPYRDEGDPLHLIHGIRYYIYGLGVVGLLMVVEDFIGDRSRKKQQPNPALQPTAADGSAQSATGSPNTRPPSSPFLAAEAELFVSPMRARPLAERVRDMIPRYEKLFAERGGLTPADPLQFHLFHLARYWSRLVGFCRQTPSKPEGWIDGDLGACVQVGSEFAHKLIGRDSPIYGRWQDYWTQTQAILHRRPVTIEAVEAAAQAFDACVADLKYDPWG